MYRLVFKNYKMKLIKDIGLLPLLLVCEYEGVACYFCVGNTNLNINKKLYITLNLYCLYVCMHVC